MVVVIVMYGQIGIICDNDYARCFLLKKIKPTITRSRHAAFYKCNGSPCRGIPITNTAQWLLLGTKPAYFWHRFDQRYAKEKLSQPDDDKV